MSLSEVLTMQEVSKYWAKHVNTVRYHVDRGHLKSRYTAQGRILVERMSVEALWGPPKKPIDETEF